MGESGRVLGGRWNRESTEGERSPSTRTAMTCVIARSTSSKVGGLPRVCIITEHVEEAPVVPYRPSSSLSSVSKFTSCPCSMSSPTTVLPWFQIAGLSRGTCNSVGSSLKVTHERQMQSFIQPCSNHLDGGDEEA